MQYLSAPTVALALALARACAYPRSRSRVNLGPPSCSHPRPHSPLSAAYPQPCLRPPSFSLSHPPWRSAALALTRARACAYPRTRARSCPRPLSCPPTHAHPRPCLALAVAGPFPMSTRRAISSTGSNIKCNKCELSSDEGIVEEHLGSAEMQTWMSRRRRRWRGASSFPCPSPAPAQSIPREPTAA